MYRLCTVQQNGHETVEFGNNYNMVLKNHDTFSALMLLVGWQEEQLACNNT